MDTMQEHRLLSILSDDPSMILLIKNKYITENMWKICIESEPSLFQYMKDPSEEMILFALKENGANLDHVLKLENVKLTRKMMWTAVESYPAAIFSVPERFMDRPLIERALDKDPSLMKQFKHLDHDYLLRKIKENPGVIQYINNPSDDLICEAILLNPNVCVYLKQLSPRMIALIWDRYPEIAAMLDTTKHSKPEKIKDVSEIYKAEEKTDGQSC